MLGFWLGDQGRIPNANGTPRYCQTDGNEGKLTAKCDSIETVPRENNDGTPYFGKTVVVFCALNQKHLGFPAQKCEYPPSFYETRDHPWSSNILRAFGGTDDGKRNDGKFLISITFAHLTFACRHVKAYNIMVADKDLVDHPFVQHNVENTASLLIPVCVGMIRHKSWLYLRFLHDWDGCFAQTISCMARPGLKGNPRNRRDVWEALRYRGRWEGVPTPDLFKIGDLGG